MSYRESPTKITKSLEQLQAQLSNMIDALGSNHIEENGNFKDVRIVTLKNCKADISTTIALLNIFVAKENRGMTEEQWLRLTGIYQKDTPLPVIESKILQYLRLSLVTMFQFRIENMITNILAILDEKKAGGKYYQKVKALLEILELKDRERKFKKLNVLAFIRNSLHSGGVHNRDPMDITIDGLRFNFQKGKKVTCASWSHIVIAIESALIIIDEILHSEKVKTIPEPISALYIEPEPRLKVTNNA